VEAEAGASPIFCSFLGIGVGIGHHFYYAALDGRRAENQAVWKASYCFHPTEIPCKEPNSSVPIQTVSFSRSPFEVQYNGSTPTLTLPLALVQGVGALYDAYVSASAPATGFIYNTMYGRRIIDAPSPCGANEDT
jgi:hypothetical protein